MRRAILLLPALAVAAPLGAQARVDGDVASAGKISALAGGFGGALSNGDFFGASCASLGDLDGDRVPELVVTALLDDDGGPSRGAVWVLFPNPDGTVRAEAKISDTAGGFAAVLDDNDRFGTALAGVGDLDGDGTVDLLAGAHRDDDGGADRGAAYVLLLNPDASVKSHVKIGTGSGGFTGALANGDFFGHSAAALGDVDGDGVVDVAVGAFRADDGCVDCGAVFLLFLNRDGTVKAHARISGTSGGMSVAPTGGFGWAVEGLGDVDGDSVPDLAVGAWRDDDGGNDRGAVWLLFLRTDGTVKGHAKISATSGGFAGPLADGDSFGSGLAAVGDLDGDGTRDLVVGALGDDDGGASSGAVWTLLLAPGGTVKAAAKTSATAGAVRPALSPGDQFGNAVGVAGDLDDDGVLEVVVGALNDDDGGPDRGAVWVLGFEGVPAASLTPYGCGVAPAGSLVASGAPELGATTTLALSDPTGTFPPGSLALAALSLAADPAFPCGTLLPGIGLAGGAGELLVGLAPADLLEPLLVGPSIPVVVPADGSLVGLEVFAQGALVDPAPAAGTGIGLTSAVRLRVGP